MLSFCDLLPPNTIFIEPTREDKGERDERAIVVLSLQKKGTELGRVKYNVLKDILLL